MHGKFIFHVHFPIFHITAVDASLVGCKFFFLFFIFLFPIQLVSTAEASGLIVLRIFSGLGEGVMYAALTDLLAAWVPLSERTTLGSFAYGGSTVNFCVNFIYGCTRETAPTPTTFDMWDKYLHLLIPLLCVEPSSENEPSALCHSFNALHHLDSRMVFIVFYLSVLKAQLWINCGMCMMRI